MYQAIVIPLSIAFVPDEFNSPYFKTLDSFIDVFFIFDIILRFRTTYIDHISGEEVMEASAISKKYMMSSSFYIDLLSTVPVNEFVGGGKATEILGVLKLLRVSRISNVIMNLNTS